MLVREGTPDRVRTTSNTMTYTLIDRRSMDKVRLVASDLAKALVDVRYLTTEQFAAAHSVCQGVGDDHAQGERGERRWVVDHTPQLPHDGVGCWDLRR